MKQQELLGGGTDFDKWEDFGLFFSVMKDQNGTQKLLTGLTYEFNGMGSSGY